MLTYIHMYMNRWTSIHADCAKLWPICTPLRIVPSGTPHHRWVHLGVITYIGLAGQGNEPILARTWEHLVDSLCAHVLSRCIDRACRCFLLFNSLFKYFQHCIPLKLPANDFFYRLLSFMSCIQTIKSSRNDTEYLCFIVSCVSFSL